MLIPLNTAKKDNLCLSILRIKDRFSVRIVSVLNGYNLSSLPSYCFGFHSERIDAVICAEDYPIIQGEDLYKCIEKCMEQIENLL